MGEYFIADGNVALRPVEESDAEFLHRLWHEPVPQGDFYMGPLAEAKKLLKDDKLWNDRRKYFIVELLQGSVEEPVGSVLAYWRDSELTQGDIEVGTTISAAWRGIGIGTRTKRLLIDYLFRAYSADRITAGTAVANVPALRSIEKCGMIQEGVAREKHFLNGEYVDYVVYAILRAEWEQLRDSWKSAGNAEPLSPREISEEEKPRFKLVGEKIALLPIEPEHLGFLAEVYSRRFSYVTPDFITEDQLKKEYDKEDSSWGPKHRVFLIETHEGEALGIVGLWDYDKRNRAAEVGTLVIKDTGRGMGFGTEAKLLVMEYGFKVWPIERIWAGTNQYNRAARCSLSRVGLRLTHVYSGVQAGQRSPAGAALYDVTREEWYTDREVPDA